MIMQPSMVGDFGGGGNWLREGFAVIIAFVDAEPERSICYKL